MIIGAEPKPLWDDHGDGVYDLIKPKMRPYNHQIVAVNSAVSNMMSHGFHALFMEMGTGKTKATIDTFMALVAKGQCGAMLVVCPKSLVSTWVEEELPKHMSIPYAVLSWDGKTTIKSASTFEWFMRSSEPIIYVVNVEAFQALNETMRGRVSRVLRSKRALMVVDESSTIKGPKAQRSKNVKLAGTVAAYRMILTGTEISKGPLDLYMQFEFLKPGFWGVKSFYIFQQKYAVMQDAYGPGGRIFKKVVGYQKVNEIVSQISPYTTRAMKRDCLDLPEKIKVTLRAAMTPSQEKAYRELKEHLATILASGEVLTVANKVSLFTKFRQVTGGTLKGELETTVIDEMPGKLASLLADIEDTDEQAIVWCAFRAEIEIVSKALSSLGEVVKFDGSVEIDDRSEAKMRFQRGEARFFVANMKTGAYGLNLQNCHIQYFYSRDLSPQVNWQAEDRSHRPGQRHPCVYKSIICPGTVDERVDALIAQSKDMHEMIIGMSMGDLAAMV